MKWLPGEITEDPGEVLLRLVTQSSERVVGYSALLAELYAKAEVGEPEVTLPARVAVLIGHRYSLDPEGRPVAVEEAIRGLVELEGTERDRCARFSALAVNAGLEAKRITAAVRLGEAQAQAAGKQIAAMILPVLDSPEVGITPEQRAAFVRVLRTQLAVMGGTPELEGSETGPIPR